MKKFNQVITVEVSVDSIAENLLKTISGDFKHREILVEAIIGSSMNASKLNYIFNALNGYSAEIDFKVCDLVYCSDTEYRYTGVVEENGSCKRETIPYGVASIVDIDLYRSDKVKIEYAGYNYKGKPETLHAWVNHTTCSFNFPVPEPVLLEVPVELPA